MTVLTQIQECCQLYALHKPIERIHHRRSGTSRNDVTADPSQGPLDAARDMGRRLFEIRETNYDLVIPRPKKLWEARQDHYPAIGARAFSDLIES